jgi:hypothetical protein
VDDGFGKYPAGCPGTAGKAHAENPAALESHS